MLMTLVGMWWRRSHRAYAYICKLGGQGWSFVKSAKSRYWVKLQTNGNLLRGLKEKKKFQRKSYLYPYGQLCAGLEIHFFKIILFLIVKPVPYYYRKFGNFTQVEVTIVNKRVYYLLVHYLSKHFMHSVWVYLLHELFFFLNKLN